MTQKIERALSEDEDFELERFEGGWRAEGGRLVNQLEDRIQAASAALLRHQQEDGHWCFEFESDATIPAEYILLTHYLGEEVNLEREAKIGNYLRRIQGKHGGWPLFHDGALDMSASVKAYFALKMIGDDINAPHMVRAREAIRSRGGAEMSNVFTRILLALYRGGDVARGAGDARRDHAAAEVVSVSHDKVSYWARTVMVPLYVLAALKPHARNKRGVTVDELFLARRKRWGCGRRPRISNGPGTSRSRPSTRCCEWSSPVSVGHAAHGYRQGGRFREGAAERRGRPRRDFPGHGEQRHDVRCARRARERSRPRHRPLFHRKAALRNGKRDLLPALRFARVGYRRLPRTAFSKLEARPSANPR